MQLGTKTREQTPDLNKCIKRSSDKDLSEDHRGTIEMKAIALNKQRDLTN